MTAFSQQSGHRIKYDIDSKKWVYFNDKTPTNVNRPCIRCNQKPTKEGYDFCLGFIEGVKSACCGHGLKEGYKVRNEKYVSKV